MTHSFLRLKRFDPFWCCVAVLALSACAASKKSETVPSSSPTAEPTEKLLADLPDLRPRQDLPDEVREALDGSMWRHGVQMTELLFDVMMLQYEDIEQRAQRLADEPKLGRPAKGEKGTINAMLPADFFVQQDALAKSARALSLAARMRDSKALTSSFNALTESCVSCHASYLGADFDPFGHGDEPEDVVDCRPGDSCEAQDEGAGGAGQNK